jgi:hypothetical protein
VPTVAAGVLCAWPGAAAAIPAGWFRQTALDGQYVRGADTGLDPGAIGGVVTHTHLGSAHTHTITPHTHSSAAPHGATPNPPGASGTGIQVDVTGSAAVNSVGGGTYIGHRHDIPASDAASSIVASDATTIAWANANSDPPNLSAVWIQSDGTPTGIPPYALIFWNSGTVPTSWTQHPAAKGAFIKGAASGSDGGFAGSAAHSHAVGVHIHTGGTHVHTISSASSAYLITSEWASPQTAPAVAVNDTNPHAHTFSTGAQIHGEAIGSTLGTELGGATAYLPPYFAVGIIQNSSNTTTIPIGAICAWVDVLSHIPSGWVLCDGSSGTPDLRSQFPRGAQKLSGIGADLGTTGGTLGHTHGSGVHTHPAGVGGHTHNVDTDAATTGTINVNTGAIAINGTHTHYTWNSAPISAGQASASVTASSTTDTRPPFYDVAFIQYQVSNTVTVTTPTAAQVFALPSFTAAWTLGSGTQVTKRAVVYANDGVTIIYDSGTLTSATASQLIPAGYLVNSTSYKFQVTITDTNGATAQSSQIAFSTSWTNPAGVGGLAVTPSGGT